MTKRPYTRDPGLDLYASGYEAGVEASLAEFSARISEASRRLHLEHDAIADLFRTIARCRENLLAREPDRTSPHHRTRQT